MGVQAKELCAALNKMKETRGYSNKDIAQRSSVPLGTLNKIFAGQTQDPNISTVWAIVHSMDFSLDDLDRIVRDDPRNTAMVQAFSRLNEKQKSAVEAVIEAFSSVSEDGWETMRRDLETAEAECEHTS
jgi:predicted transcriptional regulator